MLLCPWHPGAARLLLLCPWRPGAARCVDLVALRLADSPLSMPDCVPPSMGGTFFVCVSLILRSWKNNKILCTAHFDQCLKMAKTRDLPEIILLKYSLDSLICAILFVNERARGVAVGMLDSCLLPSLYTKMLLDIIWSLLVWPPSFRPCPLLPSTSDLSAGPRGWIGQPCARAHFCVAALQRGARHRVGPKGKHCRPQRWWGPPWLLATGRHHRCRQTLREGCYQGQPKGHAQCCSC